MSYIYIVAESPSGPIKVGRSKNPRSRIETLQTGNSNPLSIVGIWLIEDGRVAEVERELHWELQNPMRKARLGGEWFSCKPSLFRDGYMEDFFLSNGFRGRRVQ